MIIIIIIIIIMYSNMNNFSGNYWVIFYPKLFGATEDPDYRGPDYRGTTIFSNVVPKP
jgi:hypothetical protein